MSNETPTPRRVEWAGPEGWTVWADEDGCHIRSARGDCLEQCDVERLFALWADARGAFTGGQIPAPKPPTREEMREAGYWRNEKASLRRAIKAITSEFDLPDSPF